jgi:hypothetical protein
MITHQGLTSMLSRRGSCYIDEILNIVKSDNVRLYSFKDDHFSQYIDVGYYTIVFNTILNRTRIKLVGKQKENKPLVNYISSLDSGDSLVIHNLGELEEFHNMVMVIGVMDERQIR